MLQAWHIFTRTRTIAMYYLKSKIVRTCDSFHCLTLEGRLFGNTYKDGMGHFDPCIIMLQNVNA